MLKKIIKITPPKLGVLAIIGISTIMTISMHGNVLAVTSVTPVASVDSPGYQLTVNIPSYPAGTSSLGISITTANGYTDHANVAASGVTSWTFNIPTSQGSSVRVCVNSDNSSGENCNTYNITGADMSVSLSPPSGDSNSYYVYPGNTYYIYPGYRHDYYFHHGGDGLGGHPYEVIMVGMDMVDTRTVVILAGGHQDGGNIGSGGNGYGGHQDGGNIGSGGNGYGGHQDGGNIGSGGNGYGGHQDGGNIGSGGHQDGGNIGSGGKGYGGHQDGGNIGSGGKGYGGHQDRGNNKVAELGSSPPSLGTINVPDDDQ